MKKKMFMLLGALMLACLTGCVSPLMSENAAERIAAVDAIQAQDELAMIAWDCGVWGGNPKCGYPDDVKARALERLTNLDWLVSLALFKIDDVNLEVKDERFYYNIPKLSPQDFGMMEKILPKLMTEKAFVAFMQKNLGEKIKVQFADKYYLKELGYYGRLSGTEPGAPEFDEILVGLRESLLKDWISNCYKKGNDELAAGCIAAYLDAVARGNVYGDDVKDYVFAMKLRFEPTLISLNVLKDKIGKKLDYPNEEIVEFFAEVGDKVKTVEQGRIFYTLCGSMENKKEMTSVLARVRELVIADNVALLAKGDLAAFKRGYQECPILSEKYFTSELVSKLKSQNQSAQFIDCFTEPTNSEFKLDLAMKMGALEYLKKNLGDFDLGTNLKASGMTLLETALQSGEMGIADYLWEKGSPAPRFNSEPFWASILSAQVAVAMTEWMVKNGVTVNKEKVTPEMCFEAALVNGNVKVANELKTHFKIILSKSLDAYILSCVNNVKMPSDLERENKLMQYVSTFEEAGRRLKKIEDLEKAWFEYCVKQIDTVSQYLIKDAKCVMDGENYSALANLIDELVKQDFKSAQRKMLRAAVNVLINNGAKVDVEIVHGNVSKKCLSNIEALYDIETAPVHASWEETFRKQGWCRSEEESDKIEEEINLKLVKVLKELAKLENEASKMELEAEDDEDEAYVEGFKLGIKERQRKDIYAVFYDTLKKYNKLKIVDSTTPVLYCAAEFNETDIVRLLLERGAKVPCVKKDENGETDVLDMVEKKEWKDIQTLLRQAYRKNNVQPVSKPASAQKDEAAGVSGDEEKNKLQCRKNRLLLKYGDGAGVKCPSGGKYTIADDKSVTCDKHP